MACMPLSSEESAEKHLSWILWHSFTENSLYSNPFWLVCISFEYSEQSSNRIIRCSIRTIPRICHSDCFADRRRSWNWQWYPSSSIIELAETGSPKIDSGTSWISFEWLQPQQTYSTWTIFKPMVFFSFHAYCSRFCCIALKHCTILILRASNK